MNEFKIRFQVIVVLAGLLSACAGAFAAEESYRLDTDVYVFKQSDFRSIKYPAANGAGESTQVVLHSPATIAFDREKLSLTGADFAWNGGRNPPEEFSPIETPAVTLTPGSPVSLLSALPVQYLEKTTGDRLEARDIPKDSPEAPHWRLTYTLENGADQGANVRLACDVDVAAMSGRESMAGVRLPVGKPVLARFDKKIDLQVRPGEWSAFVVQSPEASDYALLALLKIARQQTTGVTVNRGRFMTATEFARFATYYYEHPQPEQIGRAIESLGPSRFFDMLSRSSKDARIGEYVFVGFFAEVFADNPGKVAEWRDIIDQQVEDREIRSWLHKALKLDRPGSILALKPNGFSELSEFSTYVSWGAFFASGKPAYVMQLVHRLRFVQGPSDAGAEAMLSLAFHARFHPFVRQTLEAARKEADPRTRQLIDDVLTKDLVAVREELRDLNGTDNAHPGSGYTQIPNHYSTYYGIPSAPMPTQSDPWAGFFGRHDGS